MKLLLAGIAAVSLGIVAPLAQATAAETADARLERFLDAMGGRAAWAGVKSYEIRATHHEVARTPYANAIWINFDWPAVRIEARGEGLDVTRAIDGDTGWRVRNGAHLELTPEQVRDETRWWESNIYRTLHRLAQQDPGLSARTSGENRLEIWRADGVRLNWFELNSAGEPIRFGTWDSETGSIFGPLVQQGPVKCPKWGTNATGTWRYEVVELIVNSRESTASFAAP